MQKLMVFCEYLAGLLMVLIELPFLMLGLLLSVIELPRYLRIKMK